MNDVPHFESRFFENNHIKLIFSEKQINNLNFLH